MTKQPVEEHSTATFTNITDQTEDESDATSVCWWKVIRIKREGRRWWEAYDADNNLWMETWWIIQLCFFFSLFWKKCQSGSQSLCISPQHGICIPVAMATWLLWDQFIWRSCSCRCHWVLLSITKLWSDYRHLRLMLIFFNSDLDDGECLTKDTKRWSSVWRFIFYWTQWHHPSDRSVKIYQTARALWSVQPIRWIPWDVSGDQRAAWHTALPSNLSLISHPPPLQCLGAVRYSAAPAWRMSLHLWRVDLFRSGNTTYRLSTS